VSYSVVVSERMPRHESKVRRSTGLAIPTFRTRKIIIARKERHLAPAKTIYGSNAAAMEFTSQSRGFAECWVWHGSLHR
jgi:hypothetical protein